MELPCYVKEKAWGMFVQPLSINHESLELLLVGKHVATKTYSSSCSSVVTFASSGLDF